MILYTTLRVLVCIAAVMISSSVHTMNDLKDLGNFWHITDIHLDKNYSQTGDPKNLCHEKKGSKFTNGIYGEFLCDSSQMLFNITLQFMHHQTPQPDFIIWTGDNLPHTRSPSPDWDEILDEMNRMSISFKESFPDVKIYPTIGNHDTFPPNLLDPHNTSVYLDFLTHGGWDKLLDNSTWATFKKGGYYSHCPITGLRVISLNTMLWYQSNNLTKSEFHPEQINFLKAELEYAIAHHEKVYIIGHISPGYYNRYSEGSPRSPLYHLPYLKDYLLVVKIYSDTIAGQFFGHIHHDMFQIYYCDTGHAYGSGLLGASVTPWYSTYEKNINVSIPVNPSIRLVQYNKTNMLLLDYNQFYFDLTKANSANKTNSPEGPTYELLYKFTETYDVPDLSTKSLVVVYEHLKSNITYFQRFFTYLTAGKNTVECDDSCRTAQLCSMGATSHNEYMDCMKSSNGGNTNVGKHHVVAYVVSFLCIFIVLIAVTLFYCYKRKIWLFSDSQGSNAYSSF